jgi:hypothetical protein
MSGLLPGDGAIGWCKPALIRLLLGLLFLLGFRHVANADSTYIYTGNTFTNCQVSQYIYTGTSFALYIDNACPIGPGVTGSITLSQPLPGNAVDYVPQDVTSVSFGAEGYSDAFPAFTRTGFTDTSSCIAGCGSSFSFSTNSSGDIIGWNIGFGSVVGVPEITILTTTDGNSFFRGSCSPLSNQCFNFSTTNPGQWVVTPEPSSLLLLTTGLVSFALIAFLHRSSRTAGPIRSVAKASIFFFSFSL